MKACVEKVDNSLKQVRLAPLAKWVIDHALTLQQIPAPTFEESQRAAYVASQFRALGLRQVEQDEVFNTYGLLPGVKRHLPAVMVCAHTDTVFPRSTDLTINREQDIIYAPGLGDNSIGVAGMLGVIEMLRSEQITPQRDVWFVATSREEGLGDLGGMRAAFARLRERINSVINIEGLALGHVYHAGIAVRRLHITAHAPGGHSWLHFGRASATHAIIQLGAQILQIQPPAAPRTTYNVGMLEGGQSINSLAASAGLWLDLRSEDSGCLARLEDEVRAAIAALSSNDIEFQVQVVGDRPGGYLAAEHALVQGALAALAQVGMRGMLESGSTDCNIPLAHGCPAVTVGVTRGGNAHRLDEYIETQPLASGIRQLIVLVLATAEGYY